MTIVEAEHPAGVPVSVSVEVGGKEISFETGKIAKQADGAVLVRSGDTVVLGTAVEAKPVARRGVHGLSTGPNSRLGPWLEPGSSPGGSAWLGGGPFLLRWAGGDGGAGRADDIGGHDDHQFGLAGLEVAHDGFFFVGSHAAMEKADV